MADNAETQSYAKFVRQVFAFGLLNVFSAIQGFIFLPVITKILGVEDYGIWSQVKITMGLLVTFAMLGLHESLIRFLPGAKDRKAMQEGVYFSLSAVSATTLAAAVLLIIFSAPFSFFLRFDPAFINLLALIVIFESLTTLLLTAVQALREVKKYFWFATLKMFGETLLVIAAIIAGFGLYGAVLSLLAIRVAVFVVLLAFIFRRIGFKAPDFSLAKEYLHFGMPTIGNNIAYSAVTSADRYFIGFFLGILFVGYYAPAYAIGTMLGFFIFPLSSMLSVVLPKLFEENKIEEVKKYLSYSLKYFLLIMIPSAFGLSFLAERLLVIFSTREIAVNAHAVVPFVAFSMLLYGVSYFFTQVLALAKKTKLVASIWIISAVLNAGLNIILIPLFGIMAAAIVTFISYLASFLMLWIMASKEIRFEFSKSFLAKSVLSSLAMVLAMSLFYSEKLLYTLLLAGFGACVYAALMLSFNALEKNEIIFMKSFIKSPNI